MRPLPPLLILSLFATPQLALASEHVELTATLCDPEESTCTLRDSYIITSSGAIDFGEIRLELESGAELLLDGVDATIIADGIFLRGGSMVSVSSAESGLSLFSGGDIETFGSIDFDDLHGGAKLQMMAEGMIWLHGEEGITSSANSDDPGGSIDLWAREFIHIESPIEAMGGGRGKGGGLSLSSDGYVQINANIDLSGGELGGGELIITSQTGVFIGWTLDEGIPEDIAEPVTIEIDSRSLGGHGGVLWATSPGQMALNAHFDLSDSSTSNPSEGGAIVLESGSGLTLDGSLDAQGSGPGSHGGQVWMDINGPADISAAVDLSATQDNSQGGSFDLVSFNHVAIDGEITAEASGTAGLISIVSVDDMTISGDIYTGGSHDGGRVLLRALNGSLSLAAPLSVSGGDEDGDAGSLQILSCSTTISEDAEITATGGSAQLQITGIDGLGISAGIDASGGSIRLTTLEADVVYSDTVSIVPVPAETHDDTLISCSCVEPPCFDPLDQDGDGYNSEQVRGDDCDDADPEVYPGAPEDPDDDIDNDCDGLVDEVDGDEIEDTAEPEDTGSAPAEERDTGTDSPDTSTEPDADSSAKSSGCGCSTGVAPAGLVMMLSLLPWVRRRNSADA
jgi:hypothetical protein